MLLILLLLLSSISFSGVLDPKLKHFVNLHGLSRNAEISVKVLTEKKEVKVVKTKLSNLSRLVQENLYVEAPRRLFPLNDVVRSESFAVIGHGRISVSTNRSFSGYVYSGNIRLPSNCSTPYSQLPDYFICSGSTTFNSSGQIKLILKGVSKNSINATSIYRIGVGASNSGKRGEGVIIGILDTGINFCHPAFLNRYGKTRIKYFGFSSDAYSCDGIYDPNLGVCEYDENKINQLISQGNCNYDSGGHGTHVAGIAAGYWEESLYNGIATKAKLIVYKLTKMSDIDAITGLKWIKMKAESLALPAVVNLSLGMNYGPHDGTSLLSRAIDELSGQGFIVITAVGNYGNVPIYAYTTRREDWIGLKVSTDVDIEGWYRKGSAYRVELCSSSTCTGAEPGESVSFTIADCFASIDNTILSHPLNEDGYFLISVSCSTQTDLRIHLTALKGSTLRADMWIANYYNGEGYFLDHYVRDSTGGYEFTLTVPSTAKRVIAVGAIGSKPLSDFTAENFLGRIAPFSSRGPTRDGRIRPHVVAPGYYVCSANASFSLPSEGVSCREGSYYIPLAGTSMSAPVVTGLVALYLQDNPTATPEEIKAWLSTNAVRDVETNYPNISYGYGKAVYSPNRNFLFSGEERIPLESGSFSSSSGGGGCNTGAGTQLTLVYLLILKHIILSLWKRLR